MSSATDNDALRKENQALRDKYATLNKKYGEVNNDLLRAKAEIIRLKASLAAQPPPPPPKQAPERAPPPSTSPGEKRKHAEEEEDTTRAKRAKPAAAPSPFAPPPRKPTATPFGMPPAAPKPSPSAREKYPGFGAHAAAHAKGAHTFGAPGATPSPPSYASPPPKPAASPFGSCFEAHNPSSPPGAGFGSYAAGGTTFGAGASLPSFGTGGKLNSPQTGFMGAAPSIPAPTFRSRCVAWLKTAENVFAQATKTKILLEADFPEPPRHGHCAEIGCQAGQLQACEHLVKKALKELLGEEESQKKFLRKQQQMWHPDNARKWAGKNDTKTVERIEKKFGEVFKVIGDLLERVSGKEKWEADTADPAEAQKKKKADEESAMRGSQSETASD